MASPINSVPMLDLKRQFNSIGAEMNAALQNVNESGQFILGPEVKKLEENIAAGQIVTIRGEHAANFLRVRSQGLKALQRLPPLQQID